MKSVAAFGLCVILFGTFTGDHGLPALLRTRREAERLSMRIAALRLENARLKAQANALRGDAATIEAVARETLGLARQGEIVVIRGR